MSLTQRIADTALGLSAQELPPAGVHRIKSALLDCLACTVAGSQAPAATIVADWVRDAGGHPACVVIGTNLRTSPFNAALANGVAGHALDFDDVSVRMIHPSVTLVPALLAVGEQLRSSGTDLLDAYLAGFEVESRLCGVLNPEHYEDGWHTTGTIGAFGATAAAGRLYGLDRTQLRTAFGIAASLAGGVRQNAGTMVKPMHAGEAAAHGVQAAALAARGFDATADAFDGANGVLHVYGKLGRTDALVAAFGTDAPLELLEGGIAVKRFACCGAMHTAVDAVLDLVERDRIVPSEVTRIRVGVNRLAPDVLVHHVTTNPLEGKFSLEYTLAVALLDRRAGFEQYTVARASDPALLDLMRLVEVFVDPTIPVDQAFFGSHVTIEQRDGTSSDLRVDVAKGYPGNPLSPQELMTKVRECCRGTLTDERVSALAAAIDDIETLRASDLSALLTTGSAA